MKTNKKQSPKPPILLLCGPGDSSRAVYWALKESQNLVAVVQEDKPSAKRLIQRRIKRLGVWVVVGQLIFMVLNKMRARFMSVQIRGLFEQLNLRVDEIPSQDMIKVENANSDVSVETLRKLQPAIVVVNGTRILSKSVLNSCDAKFINTHLGITPRYRGVHGGYWALANDDKDHCGVTVHLVDEGIDTGDVLYQGTIAPARNDSFNTYPVRQLSVGIPLILKAIEDIAGNRIQLKPGTGPSKLYYHPTIWSYVLTYLRRGVQ